MNERAMTPEQEQQDRDAFNEWFFNASGDLHYRSCRSAWLAARAALASAPGAVLEDRAGMTDPAGTNVNDKAHPRFVAGYDAGLRDGRAIADREAAEAPAPDPAGGPPVPEREAALIDALKDAAAHLAGAASAYRRYVRRHVTRGRAEVDPFFSTRADDFDKAAGRARDALRAAVQTGGLNP